MRGAPPRSGVRPDSQGTDAPSGTPGNTLARMDTDEGGL